MRQIINPSTYPTAKQIGLPPIKCVITHPKEHTIQESTISVSFNFSSPLFYEILISLKLIIHYNPYSCVSCNRMYDNRCRAAINYNPYSCVSCNNIKY